SDEDSLRFIYENIIKSKLIVSRLNENAPLINITFEDTIPKRATNYVDRLIQNFLEYKKEQKNEKHTNVLEFIKKQEPIVKGKLDDSQQKLQNYKISNQLIESSTKAKHIIGELSSIEIKISDYNLKLEIVKNLQHTVSRNAQMLDVIGPSLTELGDEVINRQLARLQELESKRSLLEAKYTDEYQELAGVNNQIQNIRQKVRLNIQNLKSALQYKITNLKNLKLGLEKDLKDLPEKEKKLADLTRTYEVNAKLYAYLLEKKSSNEIVKAATVSDYSIAEEAYTPSIPLKPRRSLIMLLSIVLGFIAGVIVAMFHNAISNKIHSKEDVEHVTTIPLWGVIPVFKSKVKKRAIEVFDNPESDFSESFRKLRTSLTLMSKEKNSQVILVTSMNDQEGKSTIVSNLGAIFQLAGYRSVVLDLDLRVPSLHKTFDLDQRFGVSTYLASEGEVNLGDIVFQTEEPNLDFIPVGITPTNPSELLLSSRLEVLITELKKRYDYVIIDSSSFGKSVDVFSIFKYVDISIVILKRSVSKKIHIKKLEKVIAKYKLQNIGFILNANSSNNKNEDILY
ncbi:MAG TPA: polysaccharide biosynthesis tyrosine autokinase, partial [Bacteroidetes bacterium]|nr:polysaccharide biosynthesis tyrosine autokinase [Bacteroidota bacterium]